MHQNHLDRIVQIFQKAGKNPKDLKNLMLDILTPAEIEDIDRRLRILESLLQNQTQREIAKNLDVSTSKVSRGAHVIKYGSGVCKKLF